ncbi:hypothetical protein ACFX2J_034994 [Malus domestica]
MLESTEQYKLSLGGIDSTYVGVYRTVWTQFDWSLPNGIDPVRLESTEWLNPIWQSLPNGGALLQQGCTEGHALFQQRCTKRYCFASTKAYRTDPFSFS